MAPAAKHSNKNQVQNKLEHSEYSVFDFQYIFWVYPVIGNNYISVDGASSSVGNLDDY